MTSEPTAANRPNLRACEPTWSSAERFSKGDVMPVIERDAMDMLLSRISDAEAEAGRLRESYDYAVAELYEARAEIERLREALRDAR